MVVGSFRTLGEQITARRGELQLTQEQFGERGGITTKTVQRLEKGQGEARSKTLAAIDKAAGWMPGSARNILDGGEPTVSPTADTSADIDRILWLRQQLTPAEFEVFLDGLSRSREVG